MKKFRITDLADRPDFNQSFFEMSSFQLSKSEGSEHDNKIVDKLIDIHLEIFHFKEVSDLLNRLNSVLKIGQLKISCFGLDPQFPLIKNNEDRFIGVNFLEDEFNEIDALICHMAAKIIDRFYYLQNKIKHEKPEIVFFEEAFQKFPFPLIVLTGNGEIWLHNQEFSKLNILPNDLLGKKDGQTFFAKEQTFKVKRVDWLNKEQDFSLFLLNTMNSLNQDKMLKVSSFSELGIMASSIAHELNNPLMGINAAITLLELNEEFSRLHQKTMKEMKECTNRCIELVSVFLGFSRRLTKQEQSEKITVSFKRALNLLRFRMIESNICLECQVLKKQKFNYSINSSVITMVFYLILNEVLTVHSKEKLIDGQWSSSLKGKLQEKEGEMVLSIEGISAKKIFDKMGSLSLIRNLLNIDGIDLSQSDIGIHLQVKNKSYLAVDLRTQQELPFL
ncbi:MAG: hypothetical protein OEY33_01495 [Bdellovibrionales bacterium]|nr:hypothetical protein [Bdellovibrionales bacterium]